MKKRYYFIPVVCALLLSACDNWLTVEPEDMVTVDKALSGRDGYIAALTGVYQILETTYNPGGFLMGGGVDELANIYHRPESRFNPTLNSAYEYDFLNTNFDNASGAAFLGMYRALANINVIAENLKTTEALSDEDHALIEGEVKALRALLQFDLWRLYGPAPGNEVSGELVLPYMMQASNDFLPYSDYQAYFTQLQQDLADARALLAASDPVLKYSNPYLNAPGSIDEYEDISWYYRQNRMNYYAVLGLSARVELWLGNNEAAYQFAKEVIDARNEDGSRKFVLGGPSNIGDVDYAFFTEHLFGVATTDYDDDSYSGQNANCVVGQNELDDNVSDDGTIEVPRVYPVGTVDIRRNALFTQLDANTVASQGSWASLKYSNMSETDPGEKNFPVIRLSEMYLILAEADPDLAEAESYFTTYLNSRNADIPVFTESTRKGAVMRQYIYEFWAEGQIFYAYKRMNADRLEFSNKTMTPENYRLPLPTGETTSNL